MHILYFGFNENILNLWIEMYLIELALNVRGVGIYLQHVIFLEPQGSWKPKLSCSYPITHGNSNPPALPPLIQLNQNSSANFYPIILLRLFLFPNGLSSLCLNHYLSESFSAFKWFCYYLIPSHFLHGGQMLVQVSAR